MKRLPETSDIPIDATEDEDQLARTGIRIPHLKLIVSLDDYGQISAAASVLNMSQPAASRMLSEMEAILDAPLCERLPRGIALTPHGKALARRSRTILLELREAGREITDLKNFWIDMRISFARLVCETRERHHSGRANRAPG